MNTVCARCHRPITPRQQHKVKPLRTDAAWGWAAQVTVCPQCAAQQRKHQNAFSLSRGQLDLQSR